MAAQGINTFTLSHFKIGLIFTQSVVSGGVFVKRPHASGFHVISTDSITVWYCMHQNVKFPTCLQYNIKLGLFHLKVLMGVSYFLKKFSIW